MYCCLVYLVVVFKQRQQLEDIRSDVENIAQNIYQLQVMRLGDDDDDDDDGGGDDRDKA
jgi:hypothetical protein